MVLDFRKRKLPVDSGYLTSQKRHSSMDSFEHDDKNTGVSHESKMNACPNSKVQGLGSIQQSKSFGEGQTHSLSPIRKVEIPMLRVMLERLPEFNDRNIESDSIGADSLFDDISTQNLTSRKKYSSMDTFDHDDNKNTGVSHESKMNACSNAKVQGLGSIQLSKSFGEEQTHSLSPIRKVEIPMLRVMLERLPEFNDRNIESDSIGADSLFDDISTQNEGQFFVASSFYRSSNYMNPLERKNNPKRKLSATEEIKSPIDKSKIKSEKLKTKKYFRGKGKKSPKFQDNKSHVPNQLKQKSIAKNSIPMESEESVAKICNTKETSISDNVKETRVDENTSPVSEEHSNVKEKKFFKSGYKNKKMALTAADWKNSLQINAKRIMSPHRSLLTEKAKPVCAMLNSIENLSQQDRCTIAVEETNSAASIESTVPLDKVDIVPECPSDDKKDSVQIADEPTELDLVKKLSVVTFENEILDTDILAGHIEPLENTSVTRERSAFYPIFYPISNQNGKDKKSEFPVEQKRPNVPKSKQFVKTKSDGMEQLIIDAGQKEIGAKLCKTCNMLYTVTEADDEKMHAHYHEMCSTNIKFQGWKKENVLGEFYDGRIIMVTKQDQNFMLRKVEEVLRFVNRDLGFLDTSLPTRPNATFLLFISEKKVVGCLVAESISSASRVVFDSGSEINEASHSEHLESRQKGTWCSASETVKAICGINRIWTSPWYRRKKVASRMVDCLRCNFVFGYVISTDELAFSDPSLNGREFAAAYTGTDHFLVYK